MNEGTRVRVTVPEQDVLAGVSPEVNGRTGTVVPLRDTMMATAEQLAEQGYVAIAMDESFLTPEDRIFGEEFIGSQIAGEPDRFYSLTENLETLEEAA